MKVVLRLFEGCHVLNADVAACSVRRSSEGRSSSCVTVKGFQQVAWRWRLLLTGSTLTAMGTSTTASLSLHYAGLHASVHAVSLILSARKDNNNNNIIIIIIMCV